MGAAGSKAGAAAGAARRNATRGLTAIGAKGKVVSGKFLSGLDALSKTRGYTAVANQLAKLGDGALDRLKTWSTYTEPNYVFIVYNILMVAACFIILVIGNIVVAEAKDDLTRNVAYKLMPDRNNGQEVKTCGFPTTDMINLLQATGNFEHEWLAPQLLEPDYKRWNILVQGSLCSAEPFWISNGRDGSPQQSWIDPAQAGEGVEDQARTIYAIATLTDLGVLEPPNPVTHDTNVVLNNDIIKEFCREGGTKSEGYPDAPTYSDRQRLAYGDPLKRVARAYLAAAPAFRKYVKSKSGGASSAGSCLGDYDPFSSLCSNSDRIQRILDRAGSVGNSARLGGVPMSGAFSSDQMPDFKEMLAALLALSSISYWDRTENDGACFENKDELDNLAFCAALYDDDTFPDGGWTEDATFTSDIHYYQRSDNEITETCATSSAVEDRDAPPSPPAFNSYRSSVYGTTGIGLLGGDNAVNVRNLAKSNCASIMEYGLFDQGRLFGVPDVLSQFQANIRPDAYLHWIGNIFADSYYNSPREAPKFNDPLLRLELYMAYRLAALTWWGTIIACVVGFLMARAAIPLAFQILFALQVVRSKSGETVQLVKPPELSPQKDISALLAAILAVVSGFWTLWVDPSAQGHYPVTPVCTDYIYHDAPHSPGGAYVTSWGKRRFSRYSENQLGLVLWVIALVPLVYGTIAGLIAPARLLAKKNLASVFTLDTGAFWGVMLGSAITVFGQVMLAVSSGHRWVDAAKVRYDTMEANDTLGRDCQACVLMAFWASAAAGSARSRWIAGKLSSIWQLVWAGGTIFLIWVTQITYVALLPTESAGAWAVPTEDTTRLIWQVDQLVGAILLTAIVAAQYLSMRKLSMDSGAEKTKSQATTNLQTLLGKAVVQAKQQKAQQSDFVLGAEAAESEFAPVREFKFDLGAARIAGADATGRTGAGVGTTLARLPLPREQRVAPQGSRQQGRYMPMLKLGH